MLRKKLLLAELEGAYLMKYKETMNVLQFDSSKRILKEAKMFIK